MEGVNYGYTDSPTASMGGARLGNRDSPRRFSVLGAVYTEIRKSPRHAVPTDLILF